MNGPHPAPILSAVAVAVLADAPALPLTDARECWPCGGSGLDHDDRYCDRCDGHGKTCTECYGTLGEYDPATLAGDVCRRCMSEWAQAVAL